MNNKQKVKQTAVDPKNAQMLVDSNIFDAPNEDTAIVSLSAGEAVVVNGSSKDGRYIFSLKSEIGNCSLISPKKMNHFNISQIDLRFYVGNP